MSASNDEFEMPTPCVCGKICELLEMNRIAGELPNGGNLVCDDCVCPDCEGDGECNSCDGSGVCFCCGQECPQCEAGACPKCNGEGYIAA